jgi:hypothetical protein
MLSGPRASVVLYEHRYDVMATNGWFCLASYDRESNAIKHAKQIEGERYDGPRGKSGPKPKGGST